MIHGKGNSLNREMRFQIFAGHMKRRSRAYFLCPQLVVKTKYIDTLIKLLPYLTLRISSLVFIHSDYSVNKISVFAWMLTVMIV